MVLIHPLFADPVSYDRRHPVDSQNMKPEQRARKWIEKKAKKGVRSYPVGTVAFYGPDDSRATKVAAAILPHQD
ncbi:MAG: hypothetical protein E5W28_05955, partial [Mesorhizobium sp.]